MPHPSKRPSSPASEPVFPRGTVLEFLATRSQLDFEVEFFGRLIAALPSFAEALCVQACNLTIQGRLEEGLQVDRQLVAARPNDATAHYNLACRYAVLKQADQALGSLRRAIELGYRDFRFMEQDRDLESIRRDPRFRKLVKQCRRKDP